MRPQFIFVALVACAPEPSAEPGPAHLRRLTRAQYEHAVTDLLGPDVTIPPNPEPDTRSAGLISVGATTAALSPRGVEGYEAGAYLLAGQALEPQRRGAFLDCEPTAAVDAACAEQGLRRLGRLAFRRPLSDDEAATFVGLSSAAAEVLGDFHAGLGYGVAAILQSPHFLYRVELGEDGADGRLLTDHELASRLSYLVLDRAPDDALLAAAEAGDLQSEGGLLAALDRLWADPRRDAGLRSLFSDWLQLARLDDLYKDPQVFVHMSDSLGPALREEALRTILEHSAANDGDMRALATTRRTWVNRELAALYAVPAPSLRGWGAIDRPDDEPRRGILGQGWFLALQSHPTSTSPTLRGKFLREVMLCQQLPGAPAGVDTSIPPVTERAPTLRQRVAQHLEDPGCASCHERTDPVGLGFEHFDGLARYRDAEEGAVIDASGELDGVAFADASGLAEAIRTHDDLPGCIVRTVVRYARGVEEQPEEAASLEWLTENFVASRHQLRPLLEQLVTSELFRRVGDPLEDVE